MPKKPQRSYAAKSGAGYDKCWTPPHAVAPLNTYLMPGSRIWEMCAGEGWLANWLREFGHTVIETEYDSGFNSLIQDIDPDSYDVIVTNPPWSNKYAFLERCTHLYQALGKPWALLVPDSTVSAGRAARVYEEHPWQELRLKQRINFYMPDTGYDNNGAQVTAWWLTCGLLPRSPIYVDVPPAREGHQIVRKKKGSARVRVRGSAFDVQQYDLFYEYEEQNQEPSMLDIVTLKSGGRGTIIETRTSEDGMSFLIEIINYQGETVEIRWVCLEDILRIEYNHEE